MFLATDWHHWYWILIQLWSSLFSEWTKTELFQFSILLTRTRFLSILKLVLLLEVLDLVGRIRDDCILARFPAGRAHLAVLVNVLEGLDQAQGLVDIATDGQVVECDLSMSFNLMKYRLAYTCRTTPCGSIMNNPRSAMPWSSNKTP